MDPDLAVECRRTGSRLDVALTGEFDLAGTTTFTTTIGASLHPAVDEIVIDLSRLHFCDSSGLTAIVGLHHQIAQTGGRVALHAPQPTVRRVLEVSGVASFLPILDGPGRTEPDAAPEATGDPHPAP